MTKKSLNMHTNRGWEKPPWFSSYEKNNYSELFYALMRVYQPKKVVELGTKDGYSAYHIAKALAENKRGTLTCYDLWEKHIESNGSNNLSRAENNLKEFRKIISLNQQDAFKVHQLYQNVDILHVDLDNDADVLQKVIPNWIDKINQIIIIEGGSLERDQLASKTNQKRLPIKIWLDDLKDDGKSLKENLNPSNRSDQYVIVAGKEEYKEKPIAPWLINFSESRSDIEYFTMQPFPSITIMRKKKKI